MARPTLSSANPVVVIGGGPAGSLCAQQLALRGVPVVLFDERTKPRSNKIETCAPSVWRQLELALRESPPAPAAAPLSGFWSSWGSAIWERQDYNFWHAGEGLLIERAQFDDWLLRMAEKAGAVVRRGFRVEECRQAAPPDGETWIVETRHGVDHASQQASFIIEATGPLSRSPAQKNAARILTDNLVCVSAEYASEHSHEAAAGVEASANGWWFAAKRPPGTLLLSYFVDADEIPPPRQRLPWFREALSRTSQVKDFLAVESAPPPLKIVGARTSIRKLLWCKSWVAIGDAALTIDPLSGGGIGRAVEDAIGAANAIANQLLASERSFLKDFAENKVSQFEHQRKIQASFYGAESRWADERFWRRRANRQKSAKLF
jgi:flavin-dependent dehydrogenase